MQEAGYHEGGEDWKYKMWAMAGVAQWLECWLEHWGITGSIPGQGQMRINNNKEI